MTPPTMQPVAERAGVSAALVMRSAANVSGTRRAPVLHNPFFAELVDGIQSTAAANSYQVLIGNGQHSRRGEAETVETFLQFRVDGLILAGPVVAEDERDRAAKSAAVVAIWRTASSFEIDTVNVATMRELVLGDHFNIARGDFSESGGYNGERVS